MDREVIEQKLESLRHCLQRIEAKCPPDARTLAAEPDLQDIVTLNLNRAVQACVDLGAHIVSGMQVPPPDTMGQTFDLLAQAGVISAELASRMRKAVGFQQHRSASLRSHRLADRAQHRDQAPGRLHGVCAGRLAPRACRWSPMKSEAA